MGFDTYANLQDEVVGWLHRANLSAQVPSFIALAETAINRKLGTAFVLSDAAPTNEVFASAPDLYLYGALAQAAPYMRDDARVGFWKSEFERLLRTTHTAYSRSKVASVLTTEVPCSLINSTWGSR